MDNLYAFALYGTAVLGIAVLALSVYAVASRWLSERQQTRASRLRPMMREQVEAWLDGRVASPHVERALAQDPKLATGVLLDVASGTIRARQVRLQELAEGLDLERRALETLARGSPARRARAAVRLGYLGSEEAVPALLHALGDDQLDVRLAAAQALVQMRHAPAVLPVLRALALPGRWPLQRATELVAGFGDLAAAPLRDLLRVRPGTPEPSTSEAAVALNVLGLLREREAATEILGWLDRSDPELRVAAARALGGMADPAAVPALARALRDETWEVRSMAAKALGQSGTPAAVAPLQSALSDAAWWVRFNAAQALASLGHDGLEALRHALATQDDAFARDISRQLLEARSERRQEATP